MMWTRFWSAGRALLMIASLASLMIPTVNCQVRVFGGMLKAPSAA